MSDQTELKTVVNAYDDLFSMSTDEMIDTALADEKVSKLEPGMLVNIDNGDDEDRVATLIEFDHTFSDGTESWYVRFEGSTNICRKYVNPQAIIVDQSLQFLLTRYRDLSHRLQPALNDLEDLKQAVKNKAMELGENMEIEGAKVELRNGYERVTWDSGKLDGLALVYPAIEQCKKVTEVKASVVVTVKQ